jgi:hypothetical protein
MIFAYEFEQSGIFSVFLVEGFELLLREARLTGGWTPLAGSGGTEPTT